MVAELSNLLDLESLSIRPKKSVNIVFVGHVDSGKSTICGRILVDLKLVDERILEKYKQQSEETNRGSWYLSWCMDLNPEEREKGKTVEIGTASIDLPHTRVNILDTPGHKQFVSEMIQGASRADIGILIVSARCGEFEAGFKGGQTKEHLLLLKAGNVEKLVVLVNKMDECSWDKERYEEIKTKIGKFARGMFSDITFIPVSGYSGDNIKRSKTVEFYSGPSFLDYLDGVDVARDGMPCLTVVEKVKTGGSTVLYCFVDSGRFIKGETYQVLPPSKQDRIVSIMNEDDVEQSAVEQGETCKIRLKELTDDANVGWKVLSLENNNYAVCNEMYAQLCICNVRIAITVGYVCVMHVNQVQVGAKIVGLFSLEKKSIKVARVGERVVARIKLDAPVVVMCNKKRMDRFSLRDENLTVAAGAVKKIIAQQ